MHFEILVEDESGKKALDILVPKIIGNTHTFIVHSYKGVGRIPRNMRDARDAGRRILMDNLPKLLKGYGRKRAHRQGFSETVILICDLDDKCLRAFRGELNRVLDACHPKPEVRFCIAIEEGEAWLLGDLQAVRAAYPKADQVVLDSYTNDSICGTWERLADAIYPGGSSSLSDKGWQAIGAEKSRWAEVITPHMEVANNKSPSFFHLCKKLQELTGAG
jgi:hypothetical protein